MAEEEDRTTRYEKVWNRVKVYIPFLQELISFYKNENQPNRQQQLQKITTMYDLLTNQRLNYGSLCKCETVLLKLYETNSLKSKKLDEHSKSVSEAASTSTQHAETDTPASPASPAEPDPEPDTPAEPDPEPEDPTPTHVVADQRDAHPPTEEFTTSDDVVNKPPLSLDDITRLITDKPGSTTSVRPESGKNLSKAIKDTLKILSKDFKKPSTEKSTRNPTSLYDDPPAGRVNTNVPYSPTYPSHAFADNNTSQTIEYGGAYWESESGSFGSFPHPANSSFRNGPGRNYNNIELTPRAPKSPPLYRRRDDLPAEDTRILNDRMDISPMYSSPSDGRSPAVMAPSVSNKDPRLRKAALGVNSPNMDPPMGLDNANPFFPSLKNNDPRLNRSNFHAPPTAAPGPTPNELPKCVVPHPNLPLDQPKKEPPKRRLSICVNQVIIEEIPPEPVLPPKAFPARRQSICGDFAPLGFNEPFHGTSFMPPPQQAPMQSMAPPPPPPSHSASMHQMQPPMHQMQPPMHQMQPPMHQMQPPMHQMHSMQPPMLPPPSHPAPLLVNPHSIEAPSVAERDPRRKFLPPGADYIQPQQNQHGNGRFDRPLPNKAPLTYLEYRRQKEMREKQVGGKQHGDQSKASVPDKNKEKDDKSKKPNEDIDITIGMVPTNNRVAAKAYAKPAKSSMSKERRFAPSSKDKPRPESKPQPKPHKHDPPTSSSSKSDKKRETPHKEKAASKSNSLDLFGEQLSKFDKMYRSSDFSKKTPSSASAIGSFKIPKLKRPEKPAEKELTKEEANKSESAKHGTEKQKSKSPEPTKSFAKDDDLWDIDEAFSKLPTEEIVCDKKVSEENGTPKNDTAKQPKMIEDDDMWDNEPTVEPEPTASSDSATPEITQEKEVEKPNDVFQVPTLPAPRRILHRRNSVAVSRVQDKEPTKRASSPVIPVLPMRITRRRNSIAVSQMEENDKKAKQATVEKELEPEPEEEVIRPRRTRKRKAAIIEDDDDDEDNACSEEPSTSVSEQDEAQTNTADLSNTLSESQTQEVKPVASASSEAEGSENVVSSTTSESKTPKQTRKRARKTKKNTLGVNEGNLQNESVNDATTSPEPPVEVTKVEEIESQKNAEKIEPDDDLELSEAAREAKEDKEHQEMVEGMLKGSTNPDNKVQLLAMLSKILDEKKLKKIQEIIESPSDKSITKEHEEEPKETLVEQQETEEASGRERTTSASISSTNETCEKEKAAGKRKCKGHKNELDRLNEDIAEMYIRDGVLSATGRRSCTNKQDVKPATRTTRRSLAGSAKRLKAVVSPTKPESKLANKPESPEPITRKLRNLKVVVVKMDPSKIDSISRRKRKQADESLDVEEDENDRMSIASSGTSVSPRSKKKKRGSWASGVVPKKKKKVETVVKQAPVSPLKTYSPKPVVKNINRELHCKNDKSKDCALCSYNGALPSVVQHYVRNHPLHEVYVSRIPNPVATRLKKEPVKVTGNMHEQNITFQCIFCQEVLSKKKYNWKLHLASHTGEYRYKCNNCTIKSLTPCTNAHDNECEGPSMEVINDLLFEENHIYGYMCKVCNFVQLSAANMDSHLKQEHERQFSAKGTLRFSILNYEVEETVELSKSQETLESDISMPELTPQTTQQQSNMSAFVSSANEEIESLRVLNDKIFVSPSKPSIADKLKQNFDEIMRKESSEKASKQTADDDEWEDIESPPKDSAAKKPLPKGIGKVKRSLAGSVSSSDDIPMPTPLSLKEENVDIYEGKKLVANVGYNNVNDKVWYLCSVGDCKYATTSRSEMYSHVGEEHNTITWDGFCYLCTAQVVDDEASELAKEVKHMAVVHIKDRSAFDELATLSTTGTASSVGSMLKLRRFSGDKLSIGTPIEESTDEPINLKPWLDGPTMKRRAHCLNMLEHKSLYCFYKCMGTSCCFTTTLEATMDKHIANHELVGDIAASASSKSWLECSYCDIKAESRVDLMRHLSLVHTTSAHQCAFCFYRSRDAYNVILHQKLHHPKEKNQILIIESDKYPLTAADHELLNRRRIENVLPLICTACKSEFCVLDAYMSHLKDEHTELTTIACQCCKENVQKLKMPRHLLVHKIGIYECMYCQFGSNTMEAVQVHVCNRHPMEPLYCCVRYNKTPGRVKEASLKSLYEVTVDENVFVPCVYKMEELNYKSPDTKSNHEINFTAKPVVIPLQLPPIRVGNTNILLSAHIPSSTNSTTPQQTVVVNTQVSEMIKMPMISSVSGGVALSGATSVPIISAVQGNYHAPTISPSQSLPVITQVVGGRAAVSGSNMPIITRVEGGVAGMATVRPASSLVGTKIIISPNKGPGVPIITNVCSISSSIQQGHQAPTEDEAIMLEAERIAMEMIKDTGLPKNVIYKCVFKGCSSVLSDGTGMRKHLTFTHLPSNQYTCIHCKGKPSFPNVMAFTQHLKTHEAQRIFCFICDYKGSFPPEVIKHVKDVHKTNKPTILFLNPKKNDPNNDIILFAPGQPTDVEKKAFYRKLIDLYNHKMQSALIQQKTHFAPVECETLPKQAIFSQLVFCNNCQYSTKVRLNMYRHLKGHLNDLPVSNVDPKNPVPCWGQGEKHFDRMRNPAASSQEDDDLIQSLCFVQENKRYICGAPDCHYLTINEVMLRNHLSTLHMDVKDYKCPHCPAVHIFSGQLNVTKVLEHLKLHDKELYRCSKCSLFLNNRNELERHISDLHPATNSSIFVIRDGSTAGSAFSGATDDELIFKWKCDICKYKSVALSDIRMHMQDLHNINAKYRCSRCLFSCSNKSMFTAHFEKQHPGCEIVIISLYKAIEGDDRADTTPLWRREVNKTRSIRGIMVEVDEHEDEDVEEADVSTIVEQDAEPVASGSGIGRKRRSTENESDVSFKRAKQDDASAIKAFKCGYKGCTFVNDFGSGIVTHFRAAHPNDKPSVLRNALANPEQSRFDYFLKYACYYCVKKADTIQELIQHWKQMHRMAGRRSQDLPFLFRTAKIILCFYCRKGAVMPEMKSHFTTCHPGLQPIYLDFRNPKRCAECDFTMGTKREDMVQHFAVEHHNENEYAKGWIDFLTNDVVDKILKLNSVTYGCEKCEFTTEHNPDFTVHYASKHPGQAVEFNEFPIDKKVIYYCAYNNCRKNFSNVHELAQHILQHVPHFKCLCDDGLCNAQFRTFTMLLQHYQTTHANQDLQYSLKTPAEYQQVLRMITIQFWNGFVMTLDDARRANNRYGSYEGVFKLIDDLCAASVSAGTRLI